MSNTTSTQLQEILAQHDVDFWGVSALSRPLTFEYYKNWLVDGAHGTMDYLTLHSPAKENPETLLPQAKSALVVGIKYRPHPAPRGDLPVRGLRIASYSQGADYHYWLKEKLEEIKRALIQLAPQSTFLCMTDSRPVLERDLAVRAGLGWFGKNTCVIHPDHGSFFLLGEIYTDLALAATLEVQTDHCGTCRRCIDACPTQALISPKYLDARRCISYWTIEAKDAPPVELRNQFGDLFFGCDICQQVCPWNEKVLGKEFLKQEREMPLNRNQAIEDLRFILRASHNKLLQVFSGTPLVRAGGRGLKRNAILVAANLKLSELEEDIRLAGQNSAQLKELANWAITELSVGS